MISTTLPGALLSCNMVEMALADEIKEINSIIAAMPENPVSTTFSIGNDCFWGI
jgi:hypothetical protein